jgi:hypothetical protein
MKTGFLDFVEDILDAMDKAEILLIDVPYEQFTSDFRIHFTETSEGSEPSEVLDLTVNYAAGFTTWPRKRMAPVSTGTDSEQSHMSRWGRAVRGCQKRSVETHRRKGPRQAPRGGGNYRHKSSRSALKSLHQLFVGQPVHYLSIRSSGRWMANRQTSSP